MIRFLIIAILLFLYLVLGIPVLLVEKLRAKKDQEASDYRCLRLVQWMFRVMLRVAGVQVTVIGEENIPDEPPPGGDWPGGDEPGEPGEPDLPQTGVLWWPVPVLACAGLFLFLIGWGKRRHERP